MKDKGFTLLELMVTMAVVGIITILVGIKVNDYTQQTEGEKLAEKTYKLKVSYDNYIKDNFTAYYSLLHNKYPGSRVYVPASTLQKLGYLNGNYKIINKYNQSPCLLLEQQDNILVGILFYQNPQGVAVTAPKTKVLEAALRQLGSVSAYYDGQNIRGEGKGWSIDPSAITTQVNVINPFDISQQRNIYIDQTGLSSNDYKCNADLAQNSIVMNLSQDYKLNSVLENNNAFQQYQDPTTNSADTVLNNNVIKGVLSLDSNNDPTASDQADNVQDLPATKRQSTIVFQMNPDCPPEDPSCLGSSSNGVDVNKQLSIQTDQSNNLTVTGFKPSYLSTTGTILDKNYYGSLKLNSIQPTLQVNVGSDMHGTQYVCDATHVGSVALQANSSAFADISPVNQVVCEKNVLCYDTSGGASTTGYCYMPVSAVTVKLNFAPTNRLTSYTAPPGFFIADYTLDQQYANFTGGRSNNNCPGVPLTDNSLGFWRYDGDPNCGCHKYHQFIIGDGEYWGYYKNGGIAPWKPNQYVDTDQNYLKVVYSPRMRLIVGAEQPRNYNWEECSDWHNHANWEIYRMFYITSVTVTNDLSLVSK